MEYTDFIRKPFVVEAVELTRDNIEEAAEHVGILRKKRNGDPYIQVNPLFVPNVERVFLGFFMTRMGENIRCYSKRVFHDQFTAITPDIKSWVDFMTNEHAAPNDHDPLTAEQIEAQIR
jgi:hypothetical protein